MRAAVASVFVVIGVMIGGGSAAEAHDWHHGCYPYYHHHHHHCYWQPSCYTPCYQPWYPTHVTHFASYPSHHHRPPCPECPSESAVAYSASQGNILLKPLAGPGREGTLTYVIAPVPVTTYLKETYHDERYVYFDEYEFVEEVIKGSTGRKIRIARCPEQCLYEVSVLQANGPVPNNLKYMLLMCAKRECLRGVPSLVFSARSYSEGRLEEGPAPSRVAIPSGAKKSPVRVERKATKDLLVRRPQQTRQSVPAIVLANPVDESTRSVILVHRPVSLELEEESSDSVSSTSAASISDKNTATQAVVRSRVPLRGEWGTPSETKIVAKWNDATAARLLPVVQVSPARRNPQDLQDEDVILVSGLQEARGE